MKPHKEQQKATNQTDSQAFKKLCGIAEAALNNGNYSKARAAFEKIKRQWPFRPHGWLGLDKVANASESPIKAFKIISQAFKRLPKNPFIILHLAERYFALGATDRAEALVHTIMAESAMHPWAEFLLGRIAGRQDRWQLAKKRWLQTNLEYPDNENVLRHLVVCHQHLGDIDAEIATYREIISKQKERPADHYQIALKRAYQTSCFGMTVESSREFVQQFPEDGEIAALHAICTRNNGDLRGAIDFLEENCHKNLTPEQPLQYQRALTYSMAGEYEHASDLFLQAHRMKPSDLSAITRAALCLAEANRHQDAQDLLVWIGDGEQCDKLLIAQAEIFELCGDYKEAIRHACAAVRVCANVENISKLSLFLAKAGRLQFSRGLIRRLEKDYSGILSAHLNLAKLAHLYMNFSAAHHWLARYLKSCPWDTNALDLLSDVLWQEGLSEKEWYTRLAIATGRVDFLSADTSVRARALSGLESNIKATEEHLFSSCNPAKRSHAVQAIKKMVNRPIVMKLRQGPDVETGQLCQALKKLEEQEDAKGAVNLAGLHLSTIISNTAVPENIGGFLYRVARLCEKAGWHGRSLNYLERAAWYDKGNAVLLARYRILLRQILPHLSICGRRRTAVLILTCRNNLSRARLLAQDIQANTGRTVLLLFAKDQSDTYDVVKQPYGQDLVVPCSDGYLALPRKLTLAYRYLVACTDCQGVFKLDDDVAFDDYGKFEDLILTCHNNTSGYVGWVHQYSNSVYHHKRHANAQTDHPVPLHRPVAYCGGGEGYYLSRGNLETIFSAGLTYFSSTSGAIYEDVYFGEIMANAGIEPTHKPMPIMGGYHIDCFEASSLFKTRPATSGGVKKESESTNG